MRALVAFVRAIEAISEWSGKIAGFMILGMMLLLTVDVLARYAFGMPLTFGYDMGKFLYGGIGILLGAYALYHKGHIIVDIVYRRFPEKAKVIVDLCTSPLFFLFVILLIWGGWEIAWRSFQQTEHATFTGWAPILWPFKMLIPIAASLILLQGLASYIRKLFFAIRGRELS